MKPDCERVLARLSPYLDQEVPDAEATAIRVHLSICPPCEVAHHRLERLEEISIQVLHAPGVDVVRWRTCWKQVGDSCLVGAALEARRRREAQVRRTASRFALAAAALLAATVALPLFAGRLSTGVHPAYLDMAGGRHGAAVERLAISTAPGANRAEVLEVGHDGDHYSIGIDFPRQDSGDAVVIMLSKL